MAHKTLLGLLLTFGLSVYAFSQPGDNKTAPKADPQHIQQLIDQLGDNQFAKRTKATVELEAIGPAALDLLRQAAQSLDVETAQRAKTLVERIEAQRLIGMLLAPKRVRLKVTDVGVDEAIAQLVKISGYPIQLAGGNSDRKITLDSGEVAFWDALAQLCRAAELTEIVAAPVAPAAQPNFAQAGGQVVVKLPIQAKVAQPVLPAVQPGAVQRVGQPGAAAQPANAIVLTPGKAPELLTAFAGAVRVRVLPPAADKPRPPAGEIEIWLDVTAEPRLRDFGVIGAPQIDKAIDDQERSLQPVLAPAEPPKGNGNNGNGNGNRVIVNGNAIVIVNGKIMGPGGVPLGPMAKDRKTAVRLKVGEQPAKTLKELSGSLTAQVLSETEAPVTVDNILKAAGKTVKGKDESSIQVQAVEKLDDGSVKIQAVLENPAGQKPNNPFGNVIFGGNVVINGVRIGGNHAGPLNLPKLDAQGKEYLAEVRKQRTDFNSGKIEVELVYQPQGEPTQLILYGQRTVTFVVPFALKDVPLP